MDLQKSGDTYVPPDWSWVGQTLEEDTSANLDNAVAASAAGDFAEG